MYPQLAPSPAPIDYAGIVVDCGLGIIASITDANTLAVFSEYRNKVISESNGERSVTIVEKGVGALLRPNMPVNAILDVTIIFGAKFFRFGNIVRECIKLTFHGCVMLGEDVR